MNFNSFHIFTTQKPNNITLFFPGASLKWGSHLYTDTVMVLVHLHYAATYMPFCTLTNLQDNGAIFRFFITNLGFTFDSPSYMNASGQSGVISVQAKFYNL